MPDNSTKHYASIIKLVREVEVLAINAHAATQTINLKLELAKPTKADEEHLDILRENINKRLRDLVEATE